MWSLNASIGSVLVAVSFWCLPGFAIAQSSDEPKKDAKQRMETMRRVMSTMRVYQTIDGREVELKRGEYPVTHYNDNARDYEDGTLWAFFQNDRPIVLTTCYTRNIKSDGWIHATTSLSTLPLRCSKEGADIWIPKKGGVEFATLPSKRSPAGRQAARRQQIRQLARRFEAWQFWDPDNQRFELRRLTRPVIQYSDPSTNVLDGAVFLFAHDVNPELVLVIEAIQKDNESSWRYAFAKIGSAEFHATLDGREVYQSDRAPGVLGRRTDPYFMFFTN